MALELKITAEIVDAEDGGAASVSLAPGPTAAAIASLGRAAYDDADAVDVAAVIARALATTAAGGPPEGSTMRPGTALWNVAREVLGISEDDAQRMGTEQLAADFAAKVTTSDWRDFLKGRPPQRYDGGGKITLIEGNINVTGTGTTFLSAEGRVIPGKHVLEVGGKRYGIAAVPDDESLELETAYDEADEMLSPRHYAIVPA